MESISQREMRNNSAEVLRRVANGEVLLVTNGGVPAAVLVPAGTGVRAQLIAAGRLTPGTGLDLSRLPPPVRSDLRSEDLLEADRG